MLTWSSTHGIVASILLSIAFNRLLAFPQKRSNGGNLKELRVGEKSQVDRDDKEVWYPVVGGNDDEIQQSVTGATAQNHLDKELLEAIRSIFLKWGYRVEDVPQPLGYADPSRHFQTTKEFANVLELLVEKLPPELDMPILNILRANGIKEVHVTHGTFDNSDEIKKIDEIISQINASGSNGNRSQYEESAEKEVDGKYDAGRNATTYCEDKSEPCESEGGPYAMIHPNVNTSMIGPLRPAKKTLAQQNATLTQDTKQLESLIQEVKKKVEVAETRPLQSNEESKMNDNLAQISELVQEVEEIAEKNIKMIGQSPCGGEIQNKPVVQSDQQNLEQLSPKIIHPLSELDQIDAMMKEMRSSTAGNYETGGHMKHNSNLDEIDVIMEQMQSQSANFKNEREEKLNHGNTKLDEMIQEMQNEEDGNSKQQHVVNHPENLAKLDTIIQEMQNAREGNSKQQNIVNHHKDLAEIDAMIQEMQNTREVNSKKQNVVNHHKDLAEIDAMIQEMQNIKEGNSKQQHNANHYQNLAEIDSMIQEMQNARGGNFKQQYEVNHPHNLAEIDSMIQEMQNAQETNSKQHVINHPPNLAEIDEIIQEMQNSREENSKQYVVNHPQNLAELDTMIQEMQTAKEENSKQHVVNHPQNLTEIGTMIQEMQNAKEENSKQHVVNHAQNSAEINAMIQEMQNAQEENSKQHVVSHSQNLAEIDTMIQDMQNAKEENSKQHVVNNLQNSAEIDAMIQEMQNAKEENSKQHVVNHPQNTSKINAVIQEMQTSQEKNSKHHVVNHSQNLAEIDSIIQEMRNSRERNSKLHVVNHHQNLAEIDAMIQEMQNAKEGNSKQHVINHPQNLAEIDAMIQEMQNAKEENLKQHIVNHPQNFAEIDSMIQEMRNSREGNSKQHVVNHHQNLAEIDTIMQEIKAKQTLKEKEGNVNQKNYPNFHEVDDLIQEMQKNHAKNSDNEKRQINHQIDSEKIDSMIEEMKDKRAGNFKNENQDLHFNDNFRKINGNQRHYVDASSEVERNKKFQEIEEMLKDMEMQRAHAPKIHTNHNPKHGSRAEELRKLDELISDIHNVGKLESRQKEATNAHVNNQLNLDNVEAIIKDLQIKYGAKPSSSLAGSEKSESELHMLDDIIAEIGSIAKQEEKHIEEAEHLESRGHLDELIAQMHNEKTSLGSKNVHEAQKERQNQNHVEELTRIMNDLERESAIELDLQKALEEVRHESAQNQNNRPIHSEGAEEETKIQHLLNLSSPPKFQTSEEGAEINRLLEDMTKLHEDRLAAEYASNAKALTNQEKIKDITHALEGFPKVPNVHQQHEEVAAQVARLNSHLHNVKLNGVQKLMDEMKLLSATLPPNSNPQGQLNENGNVLKRDKLNLADAEFLHRIKVDKRRKAIKKHRD